MTSEKTPPDFAVDNLGVRYSIRLPNPSGGTITPLRTNETIKTSVTWSGAFTGTSNIWLSRVGDTVTLQLDSVSFTVGVSASNVSSPSGTIPSRFLPSTADSKCVKSLVVTNAAAKLIGGALQIGSDGTITIGTSVLFGVFTALLGGGWDSTAISWISTA